MTIQNAHGSEPSVLTPGDSLTDGLPLPEARAGTLKLPAYVLPAISSDPTSLTETSEAGHDLLSGLGAGLNGDHAINLSEDSQGRLETADFEGTVDQLGAWIRHWH
mgnify:CR=1 FL=1